MPVLIAAVNRDLDIVVPLAAKLLEGGGEVRCYLEFDDHELRSMGCKIAVGDLDDAYTMGAALTNVHTFVPFLADPLSFAADLGQLTAFGRAAAEAGAAAHLAQTILPISAAGEPGHPIFDALRAVEETFRRLVNPLCVLRTGFVAGPDRPLSPTEPQGSQDNVSAVEVTDLVAVIAAADDRERIEGDWELAGSLVSVMAESGSDRIFSELRAFPLLVENSAAAEFGQVEAHSNVESS